MYESARWCSFPCLLPPYHYFSVSSVEAFPLLHPVIFTFSSLVMLVFTIEDPNTAIPPDYTTNDFEKEWTPFVSVNLIPTQAANALWNHWTVLNNRNKVQWQQIQHNANKACIAAQERADQLKVQQEDDEAQIL